MQKLDNYSRNLAVLSQANQQDLDNEFVIGGIIDKFCIQFELGWKLFKEILRYEGIAVSASGSPREIIKGMYQVADYINCEMWLKMLKDRNSMAHIYHGEKARKLVNVIIEEYIPEFKKVESVLSEKFKDIE